MFFLDWWLHAMNSEWPVDHVTYFWKRGPLSSIVTVCRICRHQKVARVSYSASFFLGCDFSTTDLGVSRVIQRFASREVPQKTWDSAAIDKHEKGPLSSYIHQKSTWRFNTYGYIWWVLRKTSGGGRKGGGDGRRRMITLAELRHMVSAMLDRCRVDNVEWN